MGHGDEPVCIMAVGSEGRRAHKRPHTKHGLPHTRDSLADTKCSPGGQFSPAESQRLYLDNLKLWDCLTLVRRRDVGLTCQAAIDFVFNLSNADYLRTFPDALQAFHLRFPGGVVRYVTPEETACEDLRLREENVRLHAAVWVLRDNPAMPADSTLAAVFSLDDRAFHNKFPFDYESGRVGGLRSRMKTKHCGGSVERSARRAREGAVPLAPRGAGDRAHSRRCRSASSRRAPNEPCVPRTPVQHRRSSSLWRQDVSANKSRDDSSSADPPLSIRHSVQSGFRSGAHGDDHSDDDCADDDDDDDDDGDNDESEGDDDARNDGDEDGSVHDEDGDDCDVNEEGKNGIRRGSEGTLGARLRAANVHSAGDRENCSKLNNRSRFERKRVRSKVTFAEPLTNPLIVESPKFDNLHFEHGSCDISKINKVNTYLNQLSSPGNKRNINWPCIAENIKNMYSFDLSEKHKQQHKEANRFSNLPGRINPEYFATTVHPNRENIVSKNRKNPHLGFGDNKHSGYCNSEELRSDYSNNCGNNVTVSRTMLSQNRNTNNGNDSDSTDDNVDSDDNTNTSANRPVRQVPRPAAPPPAARKDESHLQSYRAFLENLRLWDCFALMRRCPAQIAVDLVFGLQDHAYLRQFPGAWRSVQTRFPQGPYASDTRAQQQTQDELRVSEENQRLQGALWLCQRSAGPTVDDVVQAVFRLSEEDFRLRFPFLYARPHASSPWRGGTDGPAERPHSARKTFKRTASYDGDAGKPVVQRYLKKAPALHAVSSPRSSSARGRVKCSDNYTCNRVPPPPRHADPPLTITCDSRRSRRHAAATLATRVGRLRRRATSATVSISNQDKLQQSVGLDSPAGIDNTDFIYNKCCMFEGPGEMDKAGFVEKSGVFDTCLVIDKTDAMDKPDVFHNPGLINKFDDIYSTDVFYKSGPIEICAGINNHIQMEQYVTIEKSNDNDNIGAGESLDIAETVNTQTASMEDNVADTSGIGATMSGTITSLEPTVVNELFNSTHSCNNKINIALQTKSDVPTSGKSFSENYFEKIGDRTDVSETLGDDKYIKLDTSFVEYGDAEATVFYREDCPNSRNECKLDTPQSFTKHGLPTTEFQSLVISTGDGSHFLHVCAPERVEGPEDSSSSGDDEEIPNSFQNFTSAKENLTTSGKCDTSHPCRPPDDTSTWATSIHRLSDLCDTLDLDTTVNCLVRSHSWSKVTLIEAILDPFYNYTVERRNKENKTLDMSEGRLLLLQRTTCPVNTWDPTTRGRHNATCTLKRFVNNEYSYSVDVMTSSSVGWKSCELIDEPVDVELLESTCTGYQLDETSEADYSGHMLLSDNFGTSHHVTSEIGQESDIDYITSTNVVLAKAESPGLNFNSNNGDGTFSIMDGCVRNNRFLKKVKRPTAKEKAMLAPANRPIMSRYELLTSGGIQHIEHQDDVVESPDNTSVRLSLIENETFLGRPYPVDSYTTAQQFVVRHEWIDQHFGRTKRQPLIALENPGTAIPAVSALPDPDFLRTARIQRSITRVNHQPCCCEDQQSRINNTSPPGADNKPRVIPLPRIDHQPCVDSQSGTSHRPSTQRRYQHVIITPRDIGPLMKKVTLSDQKLAETSTPVDTGDQDPEDSVPTPPKLDDKVERIRISQEGRLKNPYQSVSRRRCLELLKKVPKIKANEPMKKMLERNCNLERYQPDKSYVESMNPCYRQAGVMTSTGKLSNQSERIPSIQRLQTAPKASIQSTKSLARRSSSTNLLDNTKKFSLNQTASKASFQSTKSLTRRSSSTNLLDNTQRVSLRNKRSVGIKPIRSIASLAYDVVYEADSLVSSARSLFDP